MSLAQGGVSTPAHADLLDGTSYRTIAALGEGGMGQVLEAEHRVLGHRVVVKLLREELADRPELFDRMRVEAQALARIRHPNLVMVTDFGHARGGRPFLVMERLVGRSLRQELEARSLLPPAEAAEIGRQIAIGLATVHDAGLVHRDMKPDNVFLCGDQGVVKILDFGVVKIAQAGRDPRTPEPLVLPTGDGVIIGTPRYFSPEQARGARDLDARSDIYALGLVLYRMVVGRGPFDHLSSLEAIFRAHANELPLSPSQVAAQPIPSAFEAIVMRALAKPREERFRDAREMELALSAFLASIERGEGAPVAREVTRPPPGSGSPASGEESTIRIPLVPSAAEDATRTASPVGARDATRTASPVAADGPDLRGKLPEGPILVDNLVERVLGPSAWHVQGAAPPPGHAQKVPIGEARTVPVVDEPHVPVVGGRNVPVAGGRNMPVVGGRNMPVEGAPNMPVAPPAQSRVSGTEPMVPAPPLGARASSPPVPETDPMLDLAAVLPDLPAPLAVAPPPAPLARAPSRSPWIVLVALAAIAALLAAAAAVVLAAR